MVSHEEQMFWAPSELESWPVDQPVVGRSSGLLASPLFFVASSLAGELAAAASLEE